ncbi:MAG TPA: hypothetical protein VEH76_00160 [Methylocystis sp.]|nr:hypothetical protein [Methylocystis sp.]
MSTQVQLRRDIAANVAAFTGAQGEIIVDTTNNRLCLQDGATAGGWPAAKLAEAQNFARRTVADANTAIAASDVIVAMTAITATRTWTLPAAASYPAGKELTLQDESGSVTPTVQIVVAPNGAETIQGLSSVALSTPFNGLRLRSNGSNGWFLADGNPGVIAQAPHGGAIAAFCLEQLVTLSGATTSSAVSIPAGALVVAVSNRVTTAIAGATSYSCGVSSNPTQFGSSLGVGAGSINLGLIGPNPFYSATPVLYTAAGGNFTSGAVRMTIHYLFPSAAVA